MQHEYLTEEEEKVLDTFVTFPIGRKSLISKLSTEHDDNWQVVETPYWVCREMIDLIPSDAESYIVFFAVEFLEVLIGERGFCGEKVLFIADNETEAAAARTMYNVKTVVFGKQSVNKDVLRDIVKGVNMKFEKVAVLMNPPFQADDGGHGRSAKPMYHLFVESVIDGIKPNYFSAITPSRWMIGGKGLTKYRQKMMNDTRLKTMKLFHGENGVFENVLIKGGVSYFLWIYEYNGPCKVLIDRFETNRYLNKYDIILQDNKAFSILEKVEKKVKKWLNAKCLSQKPFGLRTNFSNWDDTGVPCLSRGRKILFVNNNKLTDKFNVLYKWKICTNRATNYSQIEENSSRKVIGNIFMVPPGTACTETYVVVNYFDSKEDSENFVQFMKSKFFRFMLGLRVLTQDINKEKFAWVPDLEDYSKIWTDEELYKMFELDEDEIKYVENKIKDL